MLHETQAILYWTHWLLFYSSDEDTIWSFSDVQIAVLWFQQILQCRTMNLETINIAPEGDGWMQGNNGVQIYMFYMTVWAAFWLWHHQTVDPDWEKINGCPSVAFVLHALNKSSLLLGCSLSWYSVQESCSLSFSVYGMHNFKLSVFERQTQAQKFEVLSCQPYRNGFLPRSVLCRSEHRTWPHCRCEMSQHWCQRRCGQQLWASFLYCQLKKCYWVCMSFLLQSAVKDECEHQDGASTLMVYAFRSISFGRLFIRIQVSTMATGHKSPNKDHCRPACLPTDTNTRMSCTIQLQSTATVHILQYMSRNSLQSRN